MMEAASSASQCGGSDSHDWLDCSWSPAEVKTTELWSSLIDDGDTYLYLDLCLDMCVYLYVYILFNADAETQSTSRAAVLDLSVELCSLATVNTCVCFNCKSRRSVA